MLRLLYPPPNGALSRYSAMSTCAPRACELVKTVRANVTIDWTVRENVRANLRVRAQAEARAGMGIRPKAERKRRERRLAQAELWEKRAGGMSRREAPLCLKRERPIPNAQNIPRVSRHLAVLTN